jgi:hypothetical protein
VRAVSALPGRATGRVRGQRERADELGPLPQLRAHDGHRTDRRLREPGDRLDDPFDERGARRGELAAEHEQLGIQQVAHVGQRPAERPPCLDNDAPRSGMSIDVGERARVAAAAHEAELRVDGTNRDDGLQAAACAAAAQRAVGLHDRVPELASDAVRTAVELPAQDEPGAQSV